MEPTAVLDAIRTMMARNAALETENAQLKQQLQATKDFAAQESAAKSKLLVDVRDKSARLLKHESSAEWKAKRLAELTKLKADADKQAADVAAELEKMKG